MKRHTTRPVETSLPLLPCACANLRRAARAVTRMYNQELRPEALEVTQFTLLMALDLTGETSQGKLGEILAMDSTTLTRMLKPLTKRGWVREDEGDDRRLRILRLTTAGREKLRQSRRSWKRAQERLRLAVGDQTMEELPALLAKVTQVLAQG